MPIFEYLGPFDAVEVDEGSVSLGDTVDVGDDRAETFRGAPESWSEVKPPAKSAKASAKKES